MDKLIALVVIFGVIAVIVVAGLALNTYYATRPAIAEAQAREAESMALVAEAQAEAGVQLQDRALDFATPPMMACTGAGILICGAILGMILLALIGGK